MTVWTKYIHYMNMQSTTFRWEIAAACRNHLHGWRQETCKYRKRRIGTYPSSYRLPEKTVEFDGDGNGDLLHCQTGGKYTKQALAKPNHLHYFYLHSTNDPSDSSLLTNSVVSSLVLSFSVGKDTWASSIRCSSKSLSQHCEIFLGLWLDNWPPIPEICCVQSSEQKAL